MRHSLNPDATCTTRHMRMWVGEQIGDTQISSSSWLDFPHIYMKSDGIWAGVTCELRLKWPTRTMSSLTASDVKEDDRRQRQCASVSCPGSQLTFYPPPYFATAPCFHLLRLFGPFLGGTFSPFFPANLGDDQRKGRKEGWHGDGADIGSKKKILLLSNQLNQRWYSF